MRSFVKLLMRNSIHKHRFHKSDFTCITLRKTTNFLKWAGEWQRHRFHWTIFSWGAISIKFRRTLRNLLSDGEKKQLPRVFLNPFWLYKAISKSTEPFTRESVIHLVRGIWCLSIIPAPVAMFTASLSLERSIVIYRPRKLIINIYRRWNALRRWRNWGWGRKQRHIK